MSDSPCGFTKDQFLSILKTYGPSLSAHEVAALGSVSLRQVLCAAHHDPWDIEQFAGESGWLYRKRPTVCKNVRFTEPRPIPYDDSGISHTGKRAVMVKEVVGE